MKAPLILAACFASFGLICSQETHLVIARKARDESKIQQNFQRLFDSISKKETKNGEFFRGIMKHEIGGQEEAFNVMKGDILRRNSNRKRNSLKDNTSRMVLATKREIIDKDDHPCNEDGEASVSAKELCRQALHLAREVLSLENKFLIGVIQQYFRIKRRNEVKWEEQFEDLLVDAQSIIDYDQSSIKARINLLDIETRYPEYNETQDFTTNPLTAVSISDLIQLFSQMMIIINNDKAKLKAVDEEIKTIRRLFDNAEAELLRFNHTISGIMKRILKVLPSTIAGGNYTQTTPSNTS